MKTAHAIFGAVVAAFGVAAFVTIYEEFKAGTETPPRPNAAAQKADPLTPANSIARDFAVLSTPAISIAPELADVPKSVDMVPSGTKTPPHPNAAARKADPLTPANSIARDFAVLSTPAISIAPELADAPKSIDTVPPGTKTPPHPNAAAQKADPLTPANSVAHDFAVLSTPASSIAQELADVPKSVQTVPIGRGSTLQPALPAPTQAVAPTPAPTAHGSVADHQVAPETLLSHAEPADVCARYGGHRVDFMRGHHAMWKCVYQTRK